VELSAGASREWRDIYEHALAVVCNLLEYYTECHDPFRLCRGCEIISTILAQAKQKDGQIALFAIKAIAASCAHSAENKDRFASTGSAAEVILAMRYFGSSVSFSGFGCAAITACCTSSSSCRYEYLSHGGCELLVDVMKKHCRNTDVLLKSFLAICSMCDFHIPSRVDMMRRPSTAPPRVHLEEESKEERVEQNEDLPASTNAVQARFAKLGALRVLMKVVSHYSSLSASSSSSASVTVLSDTESIASFMPVGVKEDPNEGLVEAAVKTINSIVKDFGDNHRVVRT
jgi:hypothetical protein